VELLNIRSDEFRRADINQDARVSPEELRRVSLM